MRIKDLSELVETFLDEETDAGVIKVSTQGFGTIEMMFLASAEFANRKFNLFCEVQGDKIVIDETDTLHLIVLEQIGDSGLIAIQDTELMQKVIDEFYCILMSELLIETELSAPSMILEVEDGKIPKVGYDRVTVSEQSEIESSPKIPQVDLSLFQLESEKSSQSKIESTASSEEVGVTDAESSRVNRNSNDAVADYPPDVYTDDSYL